MRAIIHVHPNLPHQRLHAAAMRAGLERHGVKVCFAGYNTPTVRELDFAVIWGAPSKQPDVWRVSQRLLVMERGHLQDRMRYTSCGWDGLGRRGRYPKADDDGQRWAELWGSTMRPWRAGGTYALLIGQVPEDAALDGLRGGFQLWAQRRCDALVSQGYPVRYRPHPFVREAGGVPWFPVGARLTYGTLAEDLAGAALCVTYNSTTGVEAVLAGVPTVTMDQGAMAWDVTGHAVDELVRPDRESWAHDLAWTSYTPDEIRAGLAWERLAAIMEEAPCPSV